MFQERTFDLVAFAQNIEHKEVTINALAWKFEYLHVRLSNL
jgi:hypothetical protein